MRFEDSPELFGKDDVFEIRIPHLRTYEAQYVRLEIRKFTQTLLNELTRQRKKVNEQALKGKEAEDG